MSIYVNPQLTGRHLLLYFTDVIYFCHPEPYLSDLTTMASELFTETTYHL